MRKWKLVKITHHGEPREQGRRLAGRLQFRPAQLQLPPGQIVRGMEFVGCLWHDQAGAQSCRASLWWGEGRCIAFEEFIEQQQVVVLQLITKLFAAPGADRRSRPIRCRRDVARTASRLRCRWQEIMIATGFEILIDLDEQAIRLGRRFRAVVAWRLWWWRLKQFI